MDSVFFSLGYWNWFILAALLFAAEIIAPGTFLLWLGLAAVAVGGISLFVAWSWQAQFVAFAILSLLSLILWRRLSGKSEQASDQPFLNRRAEAYVGRVFTLEKPIVSGVGTVRIDDTVWRVSGPDCPAGAQVKIARADGVTLMIEPLGLERA